jgi:vacuolar iron transporter family protein
MVERHYITRIGWLRAAVLGANDGLLSTSSLIIGVAAAAMPAQHVILTAVAGLVAGSMSMAAGEFVSVSSQSDSEASDIARERAELESDPDHEVRELTAVYMRRGLERDLAGTVAERLMEHDALGAHVRDELGIQGHTTARPIQAAFASAVAFAIGSLPPLATAALTPRQMLVPAVALLSLVVLSALGAAGAKAGGAPIFRAVVRVVFWGAFAMAVTAGIGWLFQVQIG